MQCVFVGKEKEEGGLLRKFTGKEISSHILFEHKNKEVPFKQRLPCLFHWGGGVVLTDSVPLRRCHMPQA